LENSIRLDRVKKSFSNKVIFSDVSYDFFKKNYHLIGKNGVGKSTLLRLIVGLDTVDSGHILFNNDFNVGSYNRQAKQIYYVPDDLAVYPFLTGNEFFSWIAKARSSTQEEMNDVIERLELRNYLNTYIADMSFGTKKKFLLASALIGTPDFIILDEPLNGLDKHSQHVLLTILKEKSYNSGLIFSTHHDSNIALLDPIRVHISNCKLVDEKMCIAETQ
jgi:ABC-2 type transport system ATP-binding protein